MPEDKKCAEIVRDAADGRMDDLEKLVEWEQAGEEDGHPILETTLDEYGLGFDYCASNDGQEGYFRFQISYGGPSEELRFFCDPTLTLYRVEFWYLDWFDGAPVTLWCLSRDHAKPLPHSLDYLWDIWTECGTLQHLLDDEDCPRWRSGRSFD